jgi:DNA mismatch endonuclease (patch repair protein)
VFRGRRKVVQVHGCFWHQHPDPACPLRSAPRTNASYWSAKLSRNVARDQEQAESLAALGWTMLIVWECDCADEAGLAARLQGFLGAPKLT